MNNRSLAACLIQHTQIAESCHFATFIFLDSSVDSILLTTFTYRILFFWRSWYYDLLYHSYRLVPLYSLGNSKLRCSPPLSPFRTTELHNSFLMLQMVNLIKRQWVAKFKIVVVETSLDSMSLGGIEFPIHTVYSPTTGIYSLKNQKPGVLFTTIPSRSKNSAWDIVFSKYLSNEWTPLQANVCFLKNSKNATTVWIIWYSRYISTITFLVYRRNSKLLCNTN